MDCNEPRNEESIVGLPGETLKDVTLEMKGPSWQPGSLRLVVWPLGHIQPRLVGWSRMRG